MLNIIKRNLYELDNCQSIEYNEETGEINPKPLGKISSLYYLNHRSIK